MKRSARKVKCWRVGLRFGANVSSKWKGMKVLENWIIGAQEKKIEEV
jgi:hypothetical protein